jgi:AP-1 complex subunit gamma-1
MRCRASWQITATAVRCVCRQLEFSRRASLPQTRPDSRLPLTPLPARPAPPRYRERNVAKLLYIHMLGYPTHFGQMECIKLLASARFADKRIGYLALNLLLDEKQETLMLVTNSLQQDILSSSPFAAGLALSAVGNIGSAELARDLAGDVERALKHANPYVRKKAALAAIRMLRKVPDLIEQFLPSMVQLLLDKNHAVILTGVALVHAALDVEPAYGEKLQKLVPALVKILRKLIGAGYAPEYDVGGVTDPFLQASILSLLRVLGRRNAAASEAMNSVLAQVASQTDTGRNAGNAVLYEAVSTIIASEHSEEGLRVLAVNTLGRFLGTTKDNNIRYVALSALTRVVGRDAPAVARHRTVIVECLKDADVSIRRRALELVYALVNEDNVRSLAKEMLAYLAVADVESKPDVCAKIATSAARFAPSLRWHVDTLITMIAAAGNYARREISSGLVYHISHAPTTAEHAAIAHKLFSMSLSAIGGGSGSSPNGEAQQSLLQVAAWCIGEYGQYLTLPPPPRGEGAGSTGGSVDEDVSGPFGEARTEGEIVSLLERIRALYYTTSETVGWVLVAALKLAAGGRVKDGGPAAGRLRALIRSFGSAADVELQVRVALLTHD